VILCSLLIVCSSHVINKRSLLGGRQGGHSRGHHGHHQQNHGQQHHGQRRRVGQRNRNVFGLRTGRDGDGGHHQDDSANEIKAAPTGYLPAADDYQYEDDLAGYGSDQADTRSEGLPGYGNDDLSGYGTDDQAAPRDQAQYNEDQQQYGEEESSGDGEQGQYGDYQDQYEETSGDEAEPKSTDEASDVEDGYNAPPERAAASDSADEEYGAPREAASNVDESYGAPADDAVRSADDSYGVPPEGSGEEGSGDDLEKSASNVEGDYAAPPESRNADDEYSAPADVDTEYAAPKSAEADDEYGAPGEYEGQNSFPFEIVEGQSGEPDASGSSRSLLGESTRPCPGGAIEVCVEVCPGGTARVYGACVQGCADRCPDF